MEPKSSHYVSTEPPLSSHSLTAPDPENVGDAATSAATGSCFDNAAFVSDSIAAGRVSHQGSLESGDSYAHQMQQYWAISANGFCQSPSRQPDHHSHHQSSSSGGTELSPLNGKTIITSQARRGGAVDGGGILKPSSGQSTSTAGRGGGLVAGMSPETKLRVQRLMRHNAGVLKQDASTMMLGVYNIVPSAMSPKEMDKRFSAVAMEMLREQEDRDLHPFGRGGRFEGVLYSRRVKVQVDNTKFLAWIVFAGFILLTSCAIIFLAEMERRQKAQQAATTDMTTLVFSTTASSSTNFTG